MALEEYGRKLPFALDAEQSVLGSILIDPECFPQASELLTGDDFYISQHSAIFNAMQRLFLSSRNIDYVTLIDELVRSGDLSDDESKNYIRNVVAAVPTAANLIDYARIVKDKSTLRRLIEVCSEITDSAFAEEGDVSAIVDIAEQKVFDIAQGKNTGDFSHVRDILLGVFEHLRKLNTDPASVLGTPTGFSGLDNLLVGMAPSDLILVGARPGMGKTSFALNIATQAASSTGKAVCIFSLEMSKEQIVTRILSSEGMIDSYALRTGKLSPEQWSTLANVSAMLAKCDILVDDTTGITVSAMKGKLRRVKNLGLVIIDYLQLMQSERRIENRVQEVADISRNLKLLAKELAVPVVTCAQLSRGPESRTDKTPMLADLRDSGAIEQDADVVMFLYRPDYYGEKDEQNKAEIIIAKNRHGSTGKVEMGWIPQFTKFVTSIEEPEPKK